ncbi:MAG: epoxyqueuosine reductase QueH [Lachnospiraceae bacterium]|nr:epoxyqueuosine reductase QueH [Lachnospiraceae bacterium]
MNKRNYQKELDKVLEGLDHRPSLLLHSCCGPCSSYVLSYLARYFDITVLYYNPNIFPPEEFDKRAGEQERLIGALNVDLRMADGNGGDPVMPEGSGDIRFLEGDYDPDVFFKMAQGLEDIPEGGERCFKCYELRMREAAIAARDAGFDYFTTTLSISPLKNAEKINEIGEKLEKEYGVKHLPSDFKKKEGYKQSIELSKKYDLYRQDYCGCVYSKQERERDKERKVPEQ